MKRFVWVAISTLVLSTSASAQITGDIRGLVTDPAGASVANAALTLVSVETGEKRTAQSDAGGRYNFNLLKIGAYEISAELTGFRKASARVSVKSAEIAGLNLRLEVGQITEQVTVTDAVTPLDTQSAQTQGSYDFKQVQEIPVARNPNNLAATLPGVIPALGPFNSGSFHTNGNRSRANNITIDNITATDISTGGTGSSNNQVLNFSSIKEVKIITNNFSAEFGRNSGAQVQYITKSGTNQFHGELYHFLRNDKLNARDWFDRSGRASISRFNQFGGVLGGPVIKNKTHFFLASEINPIRGAGGSRVAQVPTSAMLAQVTDPVSKALLDQYKLPAATSVAGDTGNAGQSAPSFTNAHQFSVRGDHQISSRDNIYGRYAEAYNEGTSAANTFINTNIANFGAISTNKSYSANVNETHIFSATVVNEFRAGFARTSPVFQVNSTVPLGPRIQFSDGRVDRFGSWDGGPQGRIQNTYQVSDTITWMRGRHTVKAGTDFFRYQGNSFLDSQTRGVYTFLTWEDFAAGRPNVYQQRYGGTARGHRTWIQSFFFQDDFRLTPTVTLNLGFRAEMYGSVSEVNRITSNLDFSCTSSMGAAGTGHLGCITTGQPVTGTNRYWQPRIGFAWNPGQGRTVIRGGWGLVSDFNFTNPLSNQRSLVPYVAQASITGQGNFTAGNTWANLIAGTAPIQAQSIAQVGRIRTDLLNYGDINPVINPRLQNPQVHQWSFGVQRQLWQGIVLKAAYNGTKGNYLQRNRQLNLNSNILPPSTSLADEQARAAQFRSSHDLMDGLPTRFANREDRRFNIVNYYDNSANSNFHAFEFMATRPFAGGYSIQVAGMWAKSIDDVSDALTVIPNDSTLIQDPRNARANRGLSGFDVPWRWVITHVWEPTWGRSIANPALNKLVTGWGFSGISSSRAGFPVSMTAGPRLAVANISTVTTGGLIRPNPAGAFEFKPLPAGSPGVPNSYDNPASATRISAYAASLGLSQPLLGNFGGLSRSSNRINGLTNFDWNVYKNIRFTERWALQLRGELYNAFNHHSFRDVNLNISNPAFGTYTSSDQSQRIVQVGAVLRF